MPFDASDLNGWSGALNDLDELPPPPDTGLTPQSMWRTRTGQLVRVCDMTDHHLLSTIRVLRGRSPIGTTFNTTPVRRREWLNVLANEAYCRTSTLTR